MTEEAVFPGPQLGRHQPAFVRDLDPRQEEHAGQMPDPTPIRQAGVDLGLAKPGV